MIGTEGTYKLTMFPSEGTWRVSNKLYVCVTVELEKDTFKKFEGEISVQSDKIVLEEED